MGAITGAGEGEPRISSTVRMGRDGQAVAIPIELTRRGFTEAGGSYQAEIPGVCYQLVGLDKEGRFWVIGLSDLLPLDYERALEAWRKLVAIGVLGSKPGEGLDG